MFKINDSQNYKINPILNVENFVAGSLKSNAGIINFGEHEKKEIACEKN